MAPLMMKSNVIGSQMMDIVDTAIPQLHTTTLVHFFGKKDKEKTVDKGALHKSWYSIVLLFFF